MLNPSQFVVWGVMAQKEMRFVCVKRGLEVAEL
jgi:hypothetical protein